MRRSCASSPYVTPGGSRAVLNARYARSAARRWAALPQDPPRPCNCAHVWLTEISVPVDAMQAVQDACECCGAPAGRRCWLAGYITNEKALPTGYEGAFGPGRMAYVFVCPGRIAQERLL